MDGICGSCDFIKEISARIMQMEAERDELDNRVVDLLVLISSLRSRIKKLEVERDEAKADLYTIRSILLRLGEGLDGECRSNDAQARIDSSRIVGEAQEKLFDLAEEIFRSKTKRP